MHLFHQRPLCKIGAAILALAFLLIRLPSIFTLLTAVAVLAVPRLFRLFGKPPRLAVLLTLTLCASIFLTWQHPRAVLNRTAPGDTFSFTVAELGDNGKHIGISVKRNGIPCPFARISFRSDEPLSVGDRVTISNVTASVSKELDDKGIHASLTHEGDLSVTHRPYAVLSVVSRMRNAFSARLSEIGGEEGGALLSALLLGELDGLALGTASDFRRLGISHVLAVSGMHLLVISALLSRLLLLLRLPKRQRSALVCLLLILYATVVGGSPSILRALAMALMAELSFFVCRRTDSLSSLFFSGALLVALSPRMILSLSFQLSFAATFGVVVCARVVKKLALADRIPSLAYRFVVFPSLLSLSALVFTLPITLSCFGTLSLAALPANLLFAPLYELLLCLGLVSLCIGPIGPIGFVVGGMSRALLKLTAKASEIPFLLLDASHPILLVLFTLLAVLILFHLLRRRSSRRAVLKTLLPTVALLSLSVALFSFPTRANGRITIYSGENAGEILVLSTGHERAIIDLSSGSRGLLTRMQSDLSRDAVTELSLYLPAKYGTESVSAIERLSERYLLRLVLLPEAKGAQEQKIRQELIDFLWKEQIPFKPLEGNFTSLKDYRITLERSSDTVLQLTLAWGDHLTRYLSGSAAGLLHYTELPHSDTLILGSHGAVASRLPDTSRLADHLVLCAEVYPEIFHSGRLTRVDSALTLRLDD